MAHEETNAPTEGTPSSNALRRKRGIRIVPKTAAALKLEAQGPIAWLKKLFPHLFTLDMAPHHEELWTWFWKALIAKRDGLPFENEENAFFAIWSRGHSKSTHARILPIAEAAVLGHGYCLYISGTQDLADGHLTEIEGLLDSPLIKEHYPELVSPEKSTITNQSKSWKQNLLRTSQGYIFHAIGLNVGIRGANKKGIRPSLMIPDDIDDKKDSVAVADSKADTFLSSVLPTKGNRTLFVCAQNLIHEHGVINRMYTGKIRALVNARYAGPHPAVLDIKTIEETLPNGKIRDKIVGGTPTWPGYDLARCQQDIDDYSLGVFMRECQHDLTADREGRILKPWNDAVHVITRSQFAEVFGSREVGRNWLKYVGHDWAATRSDYHACVAPFVAVSPQSSALPGCFFVFKAMTFPEATAADDVAMSMINFVAPEVNWKHIVEAELTRNSSLLREAEKVGQSEYTSQRRRVLAGVIKKRFGEILKMDTFAMWHMSHEAKKGARDVYRNIYGLPFEACNPGKDGGVETLNHFMRVDYNVPHAFKPDVMGYTRFYVVVEDGYEDKDKIENKGDDAAELLRYQLDRWRWRPVTLNESGLMAEQPLKQWDDFGNALMMLFCHFRMEAAPLSEKEQTEEALPEQSRMSEISKIEDENEKAMAVMKRMQELGKVQAEREKANVYAAGVKSAGRRAGRRRR